TTLFRAGAGDAAEWRDGEARRVTLQQEGGRLAVDFGEHQIEAGDLAEGGPLLSPGEDPAVSFLHRRGFDSRGVAAGVGLGEGESAEDLTAGHRGQEALLGFPGAEALHRVRRHVVDGQQRAHRRAATADLLGHQAVADHLLTAASPLGSDQRAEPAALAELGDQIAGDRLFAVPAAGVRRDLGGHEGADLLAHRALRAGELEVHASAGAALLRATRLEIAWMERKLSRSRSASSTLMPNSFSTKATSCMARSEFTKPSAKMSSSGLRSWLLKKRERNSLILI